ncbi:HAD family hydrolase [Patescibacteria group bacterium]|nr:HAD family hydrolase [Patescibacteria group bacterium]MBU1029545.1 HAD family hydrolase [Patescibacteria group bacterium]MBU1915543.1 HAD family hydrolase [Patescibacteria group bacterium]
MNEQQSGIRVRVVFDLDDTLLAEADKRNRTAFSCASIIIHELGNQAPYLEELLGSQRQHHLRLIQKYGHHPDWYIESWLRAWTDLRIRGARYVAIAARLRHAAERCYQSPYILMTGALSVLTTLSQDQRYELYLVTVGDTKTQSHKLNACGLHQFLPSERVFIPPLSKLEPLQQIAGDHPDRAVMIGNSFSSDMDPAIQAGLLPVWIPCPAIQYYYGDYPSAESVERCTQLSDIQQVPDLLEAQFFSSPDTD